MRQQLQTKHIDAVLSDDYEMERLEGPEEEDQLIKEGMLVAVTHGPLPGVIGRLMRKDAARARLVLAVDKIGQAVSVEVDAADVKRY